MENQLVESLAVESVGTRRSAEWVRHVINLLDAAVRQLRADEPSAHVTLLEATSVLRRQVDPEANRTSSDGRGRLLAWQTRKIRDFIDSRISGPIWVSDLCALVQLSEAHFSRSFKRTFGESPHAFVIRRRVELAAECMLQSDASQSDIAQRFGFTDQAHLCKQFRQATGQTPAAWRREQRAREDTQGMRGVSRSAAADAASGTSNRAGRDTAAHRSSPRAASLGAPGRSSLDRLMAELA